MTIRKNKPEKVSGRTWSYQDYKIDWRLLRFLNYYVFKKVNTYVITLLFFLLTILVCVLAYIGTEARDAGVAIQYIAYGFWSVGIFVFGTCKGMELFKQTDSEGYDILLCSRPFTRKSIIVNKVLYLLIIIFAYSLLQLILTSILLASIVEKTYLGNIGTYLGYALMSAWLAGFAISLFSGLLSLKLGSRATLFISVATLSAGSMAGNFYTFITPILVSKANKQIAQQREIIANKYGNKSLEPVSLSWLASNSNSGAFNILYTYPNRDSATGEIYYPEELELFRTAQSASVTATTVTRILQWINIPYLFSSFNPSEAAQQRVRLEVAADLGNIRLIPPGEVLADGIAKSNVLNIYDADNDDIPLFKRVIHNGRSHYALPTMFLASDVSLLGWSLNNKAVDKDGKHYSKMFLEFIKGYNLVKQRGDLIIADKSSLDENYYRKKYKKDYELLERTKNPEQRRELEESLKTQLARDNRAGVPYKNTFFLHWPSLYVLMNSQLFEHSMKEFYEQHAKQELTDSANIDYSVWSKEMLSFIRTQIESIVEDATDRQLLTFYWYIAALLWSYLTYADKHLGSVLGDIKQVGELQVFGKTYLLGGLEKVSDNLYRTSESSGIFVPIKRLVVVTQNNSALPVWAYVLVWLFVIISLGVGLGAAYDRKDYR